MPDKDLYLNEAERSGITRQEAKRKMLSEAYASSSDKRFDYHKYLEKVQRADLLEVTEKDISYGSSWKKRGGVGAFMMLARKIDHLEEMGKKGGYDIFAICNDLSGSDGTPLAEIRDLRRYLLLVEAEILYRAQFGD